jgi:hypothetical protein
MADALEAQRVEYQRVLEELVDFRKFVDEAVHMDGGCAVICEFRYVGRTKHHFHKQYPLCLSPSTFACPIVCFWPR